MEKNFKQGGLAINKEQIKLKTSKNSKNVSVKNVKSGDSKEPWDQSNLSSFYLGFESSHFLETGLRILQVTFFTASDLKRLSGKSITSKMAKRKNNTT